MPKPKTMGSAHGVHMNLEDPDILKLDSLKTVLKSNRTETIRTLIRNFYDKINFIKEIENLKAELETERDEKEQLFGKLAEATAKIEEYQLREQFNKSASKNKLTDSFDWVLGWLPRWDSEKRKDHVRPMIVGKCNELKDVLDSVLDKVEENPKIEPTEVKKSTSEAVL